LPVPQVWVELAAAWPVAPRFRAELSKPPVAGMGLCGWVLRHARSYTGQMQHSAASHLHLRLPTTWSACTYTTYMPNKTISVPDDVVPIIESLDVPFSRWVTDQLRRHGAQSTVSFAQQLATDAALAAAEGRLTDEDARAAGERMERSAPW
jgi:hypothetical protein